MGAIDGPACAWDGRGMGTVGEVPKYCAASKPRKVAKSRFRAWNTNFVWDAKTRETVQARKISCQNHPCGPMLRPIRAILCFELENIQRRSKCAI